MAVKRIFRNVLAFLLLAAPFFHLPLAFARLTGKAVPLYGLVKVVDFPVLVLLALAVILTFPRRLKAFFRQKDLFWLFGASGLFLLNAVISLFTKNSTLEELCTPIFWIIYPLAAVCLAGEIRKILPGFAGIAAIFLIYSGIVSEKFTGLAGNWNWLQGLITALLPALALWGAKEMTVALGWGLTATARHRRNRAVILLALFFIFMGVFFPEGLSRGALAAAAGAGIILFFRRKTTTEKFFKFSLPAVGILFAGFITLLLAASFNDTRFLIWQGALDGAFDAPFFGHGCGKFSEVIRSFLREEYFFSPFPAPHIDQAHNDLLHLFVENGFAGVLFYFTALLTLLRRRNTAFIRWIFLVLVICGWFDQHNFIVSGAGLTAVAAGLLAAPRGNKETENFKGVVFLKFAGVFLLLTAVHFGIINFQTTSFIRQGDLALMSGDIPAAFSRYNDSSRQKSTTHALYQMAELSLVKNDPETAQKFLSRLENELGKTEYRHTRRLRAVAALQLNDLLSAVENIELASVNAPFSVINARFRRIILRAAKAPQNLIDDADRKFFQLCRMRGISPGQAAYFPVQQDDSPLPQKSSGSDTFLTEKALFFNIFKSISAAFILMLAVYGVGVMMLENGKFSTLPAVAAGIIIFALAVLIFPLILVKYAAIILAPAGIYLFWKYERKEWKTILVCTSVFILLLPALLLPPAAWDEQVYQIALLKKYAALNSIMPLMENPYSAYPSLGQLWLLPGFVLGGLNVPLVVSGMLTLIMGAAVCRFARKLSDKTGALTAVVMIFLSPLTWVLSRSLYMEIFITLFALTGAWLILKNSIPTRRDVFLAGVMAGAACAVKLTGAGAALGVFIMLIYRKESRKYFLIFILGAFLAAFPFFLRVWIACGNPFYPYFSGIFNAAAAACGVEKFHLALGGNYGINPVYGTVFNLLLCAYDGINYDGLVCGFQYTAAAVILIAGVIMNRKGDSRFTALFAAFAGAWIFWNFTAQQSRFLYPLLWGAALGAVYAAYRFPERWKKVLMITLILLSLPMAIVHYPSLKHYFLAWKNVVEAQKNPVHFTAWQNDELPYAEVVEELQKLKGAKIASLWERRTLYMPENVTVIMPGFQEKLTPVPESAGKLLAELKNFDYLLIRPPQKDVDKGIEFIPQAVKLNGFLLELLKSGKLTLHSRTSDGQISILRIVPETAPISTRFKRDSKSANLLNNDASAR